jgi:hypothetical protein
MATPRRPLGGIPPLDMGPIRRVAANVHTASGHQLQDAIQRIQSMSDVITRQPLSESGVRALGALVDRAKTIRGELDRRTAARRLATRTEAASTGRHLADLSAVSDEFARVLVNMEQDHATGRRVVARVKADYPEDRQLDTSYFHNVKRLEALDDRIRDIPAAALTAGGFCAPLETLYDTPIVGDVNRPVRDALAGFSAERGGIQFRPALDAVAQTGGVGVWTPENDAEIPPPVKSCAEIDCPGVGDAVVNAIYQCLLLSNMSARFAPESTQAALRAVTVAQARVAENDLLETLLAGSKLLTTAPLLSATRDILATLDKVLAYYRMVHRVPERVPLRLIIPLWAKSLMRADITRQMVGDGLGALGVTDETVNDWFTVRNVLVAWHNDGLPADTVGSVSIPAQAYALATSGSPVPGFPDKLDALLFAEGDWLYLDGGQLDVGVVRDSALNERNRFQVFAETFEGAAFRGAESLRLVIEAQPTGASAAPVDTTP